MNKNYFFLVFAFLTFLLNAQTTAIPDVNFEQELINLGIDNSDAMGFTDGILIDSDVNMLTTLSLSNSAIADLTGIEAFSALQSISINELDILTAINLSGNSNLTIATLDAAVLIDINLPFSLEHLILYNTVISDLDLRPYTNLLSITYRNSILNKLILGSAIETVDVFDNNLSYVNFSDCLNLKNVNISSNNFEALNFSANTMLEELRAGSNMLKQLDLSNNPNLIDLRVANNSLELLDVSNGNNLNTTVFNTTGNLDLLCIQVDDATSANAGTGAYSSWTVDNTSSYGNNCNYQVFMPDDVFENYVIQSLGDTNIVDDFVSYDVIKGLSTLNLSAPSTDVFLDLTGIESFVSLVDVSITDLSVAIVPIDLSRNVYLKNFISNNNPEFLVTYPKSIESISIIGSPASSIDLTGLQLYNLTNFDGTNSSDLSTIDLPIHIKSIECFNCNLSSFDLTSFSELEVLSIGDNNLSVLDVSSNLLLQELKVGGNQLTNLDVSLNSSLIDLRVANNLLATLNTKNGNNSNMNIMNALGNGSTLSCIDVDNESDATDGIGAYSNWQKPTSTLYSESCATLSIDNFQLEVNILVYPNPVTTKFSIRSNLNIEKIKLFDILGKEVGLLKENLNFYNIEKLPIGLYFLKVETSKGTAVKKIVKN